MKKIVIPIALFMTTLLLLVNGCGIEYRENPNCNYISLENFRSNGVEIVEPKEISQAGKIYVYKNTLLVQEVDQGIHVIDNSDKKNPIPKAFIKIMGNLDMAVKEGYLYIDSYIDLVVLDINNLEQIKVVNRKENTFSYDPYQSAGDFSYYFDCGEYNQSKGILVRGAKS